MTDEEVARFAPVLSEAERIRTQIAEDEAAVHANGREPSRLAAVPAVEYTSTPAAVAAA